MPKTTNVSEKIESLRRIIFVCLKDNQTGVLGGEGRSDKAIFDCDYDSLINDIIVKIEDERILES